MKVGTIVSACIIRWTERVEFDIQRLKNIDIHLKSSPHSFRSWRDPMYFSQEVVR